MPALHRMVQFLVVATANGADRLIWFGNELFGEVGTNVRLAYAVAIFIIPLVGHREGRGHAFWRWGALR